jgi:hypothetical protein
MSKDTLTDEIRAFYAQNKANKRVIQDLGHVEYRMFDLIERLINLKGGKKSEKSK